MAYSPDVISYGYSGLVLVGGIIGFLKAGKTKKINMLFNLLYSR